MTRSGRSGPPIQASSWQVRGRWEPSWRPSAEERDPASIPNPFHPRTRLPGYGLAGRWRTCKGVSSPRRCSPSPDPSRDDRRPIGACAPASCHAQICSNTLSSVNVSVVVGSHDQRGVANRTAKGKTLGTSRVHFACAPLCTRWVAPPLGVKPPNSCRRPRRPIAAAAANTATGASPARSASSRAQPERPRWRCELLVPVEDGTRFHPAE